MRFLVKLKYTVKIKSKSYDNMDFYNALNNLISFQLFYTSYTRLKFFSSI